MEVFWHLARVSAGINVPQAGDSAELSFSSFRREVEQYFAQHYAEPLSIDDIADHFHFSRQYFSKLFRRVMGVPPHTYLTELRLRQAEQLLALPDLSVEAVASNVGFNDPYYFSRCFRQHLGVSPSQYRREMRATRDR
jgi:AraC-like DNA-binding protein